MSARRPQARAQPRRARAACASLATALLVAMAALFVARHARSSAAIPPGATSAPSPRRRWSAASPTGSRSPRCSATRSACRSRTPRSSRATRTASATRSPRSCSDNFLIPSVVARRMRRLDVAGAVGRFLAKPAGRGRGCARAARGCSPTSSEALDQERLGGMVKGALAERSQRRSLAAARPDARGGDRRASATCRCSMRIDHAGPAARSKPTRS